MRARRYADWRTMIIPLAAVALIAAACGGDDDGDAGTATAATGTAAAGTAETAGGGASGEQPTVTVGSFNFPESVLLAEIYAQALEAEDYPVARELNLGARELIFGDLQSGDIDLLPEYVGSALGVGFGGEPTSDTDETAELLQEQFEESNVTVLEPAPAQNKNVFVITQEFAESNGLESVSDLASVEGTVSFAGPPECEERSTCFGGLQDTYGLDNLEFQTIQEGPIRVSSLQNGDVDMALLFSTDPVINQESLVVLDDDEGIVPAENIVPVVTDEIVDAYGDEFTSYVNSVTEQIETESLLDLNQSIAVEGEDPADAATTWLEDNGVLG